jgi:DNA-directed RNA polymerase subunit beta
MTKTTENKNIFRQRDDFSKIKTSIPVPNLIDIQKNSYQNFLQMDRLPSERQDVGLKSVFESLFPIADFAETCSLEFVDYTLGTWECKCGRLQGIHHNRTPCSFCGHMIVSDQDSGQYLFCPQCGTENENQRAICDVCGTSVRLKVKYQVDECRERGLTYDAPLKVTVRLVVWDKEEDSQETSPYPRDIKEQEVYFGDLPLMTDQGTFIINGTERVIVSQMHRSPGVFFSRGDDKKSHNAQIIPYRGSWVEFETDGKNVLYVRIDRKRKFLGTCFIRALGCVDPAIHNNESILRKFHSGTPIGLADGQLMFGHIDRVVGTRLGRELLDEKGEALLPEGKKIARSTLKQLKKAGIEWIPVQWESAPQMILIADVVDAKTGEIVAEANSPLTAEILERCGEAGVG